MEASCWKDLRSLVCREISQCSQWWSLVKCENIMICGGVGEWWIDWLSKSGTGWPSALDKCPCGKCQSMSHNIVNSCPQSKLEGGYSNCTQLMMLLLNVWKHTTINALDNNCYAESQWINGTVNCQIKKVLRYQPATQTTQQCKLITKKQ